MKHEDFAGKISVFRDGEISEKDRLIVETHLKTCAECRREEEIISTQAEYLRQGRQISPDDYFVSRVNSEIDSRPAGRGLFDIGRLIPIPLAMSFLILIFSGYMIAAPVLYGMGNDSVRTGASEMLKKVAVSCVSGGIFAPAMFAELSKTCVENACACSTAECCCDMKKGGVKHGK